MAEVITTMQELEDAAQRLYKAGDHLYKLQKEFEGVDGVGVEYETAVQNEFLKIYEEWENGKPPGETTRRAIAERNVRNDLPHLYENYLEKKTEIEATKLWISAVKQSISARQSVLRGERG